MNKTIRQFLLPLFISSTLLAAGDGKWRSELYPENGNKPEAANLDTDKVLQDFSYAGYHSGEAAIPDVKGPVFDVTAAPYSADPTGAIDATTAIQSAINAAGKAGGGVVFLPAGTFRLSVPSEKNEALLIDKPKVVLRGAGSEHTFLLNTTYSLMRYKTIIRVRNPGDGDLWQAGSFQTPLSRDLLNSTTKIPVSDARRFKPSDTVIVRNDITEEWIREHKETAWEGHAGARTLRGLVYRRTVKKVDISAGILTVSAPIRYSLKLRDKARVVLLASAPLSEVGLEDFSVGNIQHPGTRWQEGDSPVKGMPGYEITDAWFITVERAEDCWVRRVSSFQPEGNTSTAHLLSCGIRIRESTRVTVENCSLRRPQYGGGGGNGYLYQLFDAAECLIQRSEARYARHGFQITGMGASGNVIHDCLDAETGRATGATGYYKTGGAGSDHHAHFSQANLIDVCTAEDSRFEVRYRPYGSVPQHRLAGVHSVFWNTRGMTGEKGQKWAAVVLSEQARYGYIIGTRGECTRVILKHDFPAGTDPIDYLEGEGKGDTLEPFSLFQDQRLRRLGSVAVRNSKTK
ncbi:hypothetical protein Ga0100231_024580 [Opitutaceae bacterium TAV4]|nr:hypothetical protein Ga0100231_024580 [Opitutaceae bacterium TAV4]RRK00957.1 hypothetical protein Ga0100230_024655 [Opitutaceae bacterium TAV3]